jgi:asparagine synthase (glutamine-hydrolysing)
MCGICGVAWADPGRLADPVSLKAMAQAVSHRGPDGEGFHRAPGIGLAMRRLSIIDLETGDHPIANEDGSVLVICNGEIYNHIELRQELISAGHRFRTRSDVEVIVHLYEDCGPAAVHRLRGMFAFALWDSRRHRLMLARDRLGIKPLVYAIGPEGIHFGSEAKSIVAGGGLEPRLDPGAVAEFFGIGFAIAPRTFFAGARRLPPGHWLLYEDARATVERYWDVPFPEGNGDRPERSAAEWSEGLREKLAEAVRLHLRSDVPLGAWLSSGLDSSAVVALMTQRLRHRFPTISLEFEHPEFDEVGETKTLDAFDGINLESRRATCRRAHFELYPQAIWHVEDPTTTGNEIPRLLLARATAGLKTVLTGEGADEILGGYWWYRLDRLFRPLARLPRAVRRAMLLGPVLPRRWPYASSIFLAPGEMDLVRYAAMIGPLHVGLHDRLFTPDFGRRVAMEREETSSDEYASSARRHPLEQLQYIEIKTRLPDFINQKVDRVSMAYSVEVRLPFLDHEVVEYCIAIPPNLKMRRLEEKHVLREAMRGDLPAEVIRRRKRGLMTPYRHWLRADLPEFARDLLSAGSLEGKGYFDPSAVARLLARHRAGEDYGWQLLGVLAIQLWDELFVCGRRPSDLAP